LENGPAAIRAVITGRVQGVSFRAFTCHKADLLGITGWVRNLPDGISVEVEAEGKHSQLEEFIQFLEKGPPGARVQKTNLNWRAYSGKYSGFVIRR
jgi:acylphosphatase